MSVRASCGCGWSTEVDDRYAGKKGKCPRCGTAVAIPLSDYEVIVDEPLIERPTVRTLPPEPKPAAVPAAYVPPAKQPVAFPQVQVQLTNKTANVTGIVSVVFGAIALAISWIPLLGILAIPGALIGLLLCVVGLVVALAGRKHGIASPLVGGGLSALALLVTFVVTGATVSGIDAMAKASKEIREKQNQVAQAQPVAAPPAELPKAGPQPELPAAAGAPWLKAGRAGEIGDVQVMVMDRGLVQKVPLQQLGGQTGTSQEPALMVRLWIKNLSATRKLDITSWSGGAAGIGDQATIVDNFGNRYRQIDYGFGSKVNGSFSGESLYPGKMIGDVLVFEPPIANVEWLEITLPGESVGVEGKFVFRMFADQIEGESP